MRLGIIGKRQSGKSTLSAALVNEGWCRLSFADPFKTACVDAVNAIISMVPHTGRSVSESPFTREELESNKEAFRPFLQWVGTELGKEYFGRPNIWTDILLEQVHRGECENYVVDDVRFPEEVEALIKNGFYIVKVERPSVVNNEAKDQHRSESLVDTLMYNALIINEGGVDDYLARAKAVIYKGGKTMEALEGTYG